MWWLGAWVAEVTGLIELRGWPAGTRLILRKERPHPGAQRRITDADGLRSTGFLTNTASGGPGRQLADLELRHRRHGRVEDPGYEPKRMRLHILATRTARAHRTPALPAHRLGVARPCAAGGGSLGPSEAGCARRRTPGCATCPSTTPTRTGSGSRSPHWPRTCWPGAHGSRCPPPSRFGNTRDGEVPTDTGVLRPVEGSGPECHRGCPSDRRAARGPLGSRRRGWRESGERSDRTAATLWPLPCRVWLLMMFASQKSESGRPTVPASGRHSIIVRGHRRRPAPSAARGISVHQYGSLITSESSRHGRQGCGLRELVRRVGVEPTTRWLGVA